MPKRIRHEYTKDEAKEELRDIAGCLSCGMPNARTQREIASEIADFCPSCVDQHGHLKPYEEVYERLVTRHYMKELKMSRPEAEKAAQERLSNLPAWRERSE